MALLLCSYTHNRWMRQAVLSSRELPSDVHGKLKADRGSFWWLKYTVKRQPTKPNWFRPTSCYFSCLQEQKNFTQLLQVSKRKGYLKRSVREPVNMISMSTSCFNTNRKERLLGFRGWETKCFILRVPVKKHTQCLVKTPLCSSTWGLRVPVSLVWRRKTQIAYFRLLYREVTLYQQVNILGEEVEKCWWKRSPWALSILLCLKPDRAEQLSQTDRIRSPDLSLGTRRAKGILVCFSVNQSFQWAPARASQSVQVCLRLEHELWNLHRWWVKSDKIASSCWAVALRVCRPSLLKKQALQGELPPGLGIQVYPSHPWPGRERKACSQMYYLAPVLSCWFNFSVRAFSFKLPPILLKLTPLQNWTMNWDEKSLRSTKKV